MSWVEFEFGDIVDKIKGGGTPSKQNQEYWNGDIFWASVKDMEEGKYRLSSTQDTITQIGLENSASNLIPKDTLIIATRMGLGRAFINEVDLTINQDLKAIFPKLDVVDTKFLLWWYVNNGKYIENLGNGATVKGIRLEQLKAIKIYLPHLPTQKRIASILSTYDDLIENNLKRIKLLEETAQNIYKEWFVNFRFPNYENTPFNEETGLPVGWGIKTIEESKIKMIDGDRGKNYPKSSEFHSNGYCLFINTGNVRRTGFDFSETKFITEEKDSLLRNGKLQNNDIILTTRGTIGNVAIYLENNPFSNIRINSGMLIIRTDETEIKSIFLHEVFKSDIFYSKLISNSSGSAQPQLPIGTLKHFEMVIPNIEIQNNFSRIVFKLYQSISILKIQNQKLKEARDILLPRLMNRTIEV